MNLSAWRNKKTHGVERITYPTTIWRGLQNPTALTIFWALRQLNRKADDMRRIEGNTFRTERCKMRPAPSNLPSLFRIRGRLFSAFALIPWRLEQGGFNFGIDGRRCESCSCRISRT